MQNMSNFFKDDYCKCKSAARPYFIIPYCTIHRHILFTFNQKLNLLIKLQVYLLRNMYKLLMGGNINLYMIFVSTKQL